MALSLIIKGSPVKWYGRVLCTDYESIANQNYRRRGRWGFGTINIQDYTLESQTAIISRITELKEVQDSTTDPYSTNKTAGEL